MDDDPPEARELSLEVRQLGVAATVSVSGELDAFTAPDLADLCRLIHAQGSREVVIDLTDTSFLDSAGLRTLVEAHQLFADGGALRLAHATEPVMRLLGITGLTGYFSIEDSRRP